MHNQSINHVTCIHKHSICAVESAWCSLQFLKGRHALQWQDYNLYIICTCSASDFSAEHVYMHVRMIN